MRKALTKVLSGASVAGMALVLAVAPVAADTDLGHSGQVGQHSLRDGDYQHPGATCRYVVLESGSRGSEWLLKRIDVRPPRMRSVGSRQRVGWRFSVQRSSDEQVWKTTYKSPVQKATAYSGADASFTAMGVPVSVPAGSYNEPAYRVRVTMFWYGSDGNVLGTARHGVDYYRFVDDGEASHTEWDWCLGDVAIHGDGP
jgi:hypothetical protein